MDFATIQNAVLSDRFGEERRADAKNWINYRYARLWALAPWDFKLQTTTLAVGQGASNVDRSALGDILSIQDATTGTYYTSIGAIRPEDFYLFARTSGSGLAYSYTIIGDKIYFDRPMDTARNLTVVSNKAFVPLVGDGESPLLPSEFHYLLVHGATAEGLVREQDPGAEIEEQRYQEGISDMRAEYLSKGNFVDAYPSWP